MDGEFFYTLGLIILAGSALVSLPALFFVPAPYGRHRRSGFGAEMDARLGWLLEELPAPTVFAIVFFTGQRATDAVPLLFFCLWQAHYIDRSFIFPLRMRATGKKNPVLTVVLATTFNLLNSYVNAFVLTHMSVRYPLTWLADPRCIIGLVLFAVGYAVNRHSDWILLRLRAPGGTGYKIPRGGFFRWLSSPNYFGEIVQWWGWALTTWALPGLVFAVFTCANLIPRAWSHHKWYRQTFSDYPPERRAVIPGIL